MLENKEIDDEVYNFEKERILLLFKKENYNNQQKKWFLESKMIEANKVNDQRLINLYKEIEEMIE
jgi:hypothetical protein